MLRIGALLIMLLVSMNVFTQNKTDEVLITYFSKAPVFDGDLIEFVQSNVNYPLSARKDSVEGRVIVAFMIDTLGNTFDAKILRSVREDVDQEALRVARLIKFDKPAMRNDRAICIRYVVPIDFNICKSMIFLR